MAIKIEKGASAVRGEEPMRPCGMTGSNVYQARMVGSPRMIAVAKTAVVEKTERAAAKRMLVRGIFGSPELARGIGGLPEPVSN